MMEITFGFSLFSLLGFYIMIGMENLIGLDIGKKEYEVFGMALDFYEKNFYLRITLFNKIITRKHHNYKLTRKKR